MSDEILDVKSVVAWLKAELKPRGWKARGFTLSRTTDEGNTLLVEVQKSRDAGAPKITLNYGVYSARLGRARRASADEAADVSAAHWRNRIHDENNREIWLVLDGHDVRHRLQLLLAGALAELDRHASDAALRDVWLSGYGGGLTKFDLLVNLVLLLDQIGPADKLAPAVQELRAFVDGKPQAGTARYYLGALWPSE